MEHGPGPHATPRPSGAEGGPSVGPNAHHLDPIASADTNEVLSTTWGEDLLEFTDGLLHHLRDVSADGTSSPGAVVASLRTLYDDIAHLVPSCYQLSFILQRNDGPVTVCAGPTGPARHGGPRAQASLTVLPNPATDDVLVLHSDVEGAFLLFAEELREVVGGDVLLDEDLSVAPTADGPTVARHLEDVHQIDQAVGALLDQEGAGGAALRELRRRADAARLPLAEAARLLLEGLPGPETTGGPATGPG